MGIYKPYHLLTGVLFFTSPYAVSAKTNLRQQPWNEIDFSQATKIILERNDDEDVTKLINLLKYKLKNFQFYLDQKKNVIIRLKPDTPHTPKPTLDQETWDSLGEFWEEMQKNGLGEFDVYEENWQDFDNTTNNISTDERSYSSSEGGENG